MNLDCPRDVTFHCLLSSVVNTNNHHQITGKIKLQSKKQMKRSRLKVTQCPTRIAASSARGPSLPAELTSALKTPRFQLENSHIHTYTESQALFRS